MMRLQQFGRTVLLSVLVLGLNVLCVLAITHARHPNHARANVAHGHGSSFRRLSREQAGADDEQPNAPDVAAVSVSKRQHWPHAPVAALHVPTLQGLAYGDVDPPTPITRVLAINAAPRAPGAPRGPPLS